MLPAFSGRQAAKAAGAIVPLSSVKPPDSPSVWISVAGAGYGGPARSLDCV